MKNRNAYKSRRLIAAYFFIILCIGIISCVVRIRWQGLIYNFDFGIYQPDGAHYTFQTLRFLGHTPQEANKLVFNWYSAHSAKDLTFTNSSLLPNNNSVWGLVAPRILYPVLSMPFVSILGISGMMIIPCASFILLLLIIGKVGLSLEKPKLAILLIVLYSSSPTVLRWMISNCTDSLLTFLFAWAAAVLFFWRGTKRDLITIFLLVILTGLTRFSITIWVPIVTTLFFHRRVNKIKALLLLLTSLAVFIPTLLFSFKVPGESSSEQVTANFGRMVLNLCKVFIFEIGELVVLDRIFIMLLIAAVFFSILNWRRFTSGLFLASATGVCALTLINPVLGVNFRYQLPIISIMAILLLENIAEISLTTMVPPPKWFRGIFAPSNLAPKPEGE